MQQNAKQHFEKIARRRRRTAVIYAALILTALGLCYLFVWQRVYTLQLAEEFSHRRQRVYDLKERCRSLDYDISQLASLKRIEDIARRDFALLPARELLLANLNPKAPKTTGAFVNVTGTTPEPAKTTKTVKTTKAVLAKKVHK